MKTYGYWIMALIGVAVGLVLFLQISKKQKEKHGNFFVNLPFAVLGGMVGAKVFGIISYSLYCLTQKIALGGVLKNSGWVFYGGMLGFFAVIYSLKTVTDLQKNAALCSFVLFHSIARIGCYFAGCCYGSFYKTPIQLTESFLVFLLFLLLTVRLLRGKHNLFKTYLVGYSAIRFFTEFYRTDIVRGVLVLSFSQWISLGLVVAVMVITIKQKVKFKK